MLLRLACFAGLPLLFVFTTGCSSAADYLSRGDKAFARRNYAEASLNYRKAIQKEPSLVEAIQRLGQCQFKQNEYVQALASYERALRLRPGDDSIRAEYANAAISAYLTDPGRPKSLYDQAAKLAGELLDKDLKSFDGLRLRASLFYIDRHFLDAIQMFREANKVKPMQPEIIIALAEALRQIGETSEAEALAMELTQRHPDFGPIYDWLYSLYIATDRPDKAESILVNKVKNNSKDTTALLQLAAYYNRVQKPAEMNAALDHLVNWPGDLPDRYIQLGDFYVSIRKWDDALRWFESGVKMDEKRASAYRSRIVAVYLQQKKWAESLDLLGRMIAEDPADWESQAKREEILINAGTRDQLQQALSECQGLIKQHPQDARLPFLLGRLYLKLGDTSNADKAFNQAASQDRNYIEPRLALAELDRTRGNFPRTLALAERVLAIAPDNSQARLLHASAETALGQYDAAQRELDLLSQQFPNSSEVSLELGLLKARRKQFAAAQAIFESVLRAKPADTGVLAALVNVYLAQKQYPRALAAVTQAFEEYPDSIALRELLGRTALAAGETNVALEQYHELTQLVPNDASYWVKLAEILELKQDFNGAVAALDKAKQCAPSDAQVASRLAVAEQLAGANKSAEIEYRRSLQLAPSDASTLNNRAYFLAEHGANLDQALSDAEAAMRQLPGNPGVLDTLAWIYVKRNMNESAIAVLKKLVERYPHVSAFRYHFAMALYQKGETRQAKTELSAALGENPTTDEQLKIRELMQKVR